MAGYKYLLGIWFPATLLLSQSYNWPCQPFDQQHWINGTFCECRSGSSGDIDHFHDGVDIHLSEGGGDLQFFRPDGNWQIFAPHKPREYNNYNSTSWTVPVQQNRLLIFPAYIPHRIMRNSGKKIRYSLAFNVIPKGIFGWGDSKFNWPNFLVDT